MYNKNNYLLNWGLGLGIVSMFFHESPIFPLLALIINYIILIKHDYTNKEIGLWKGIVGFSLGTVYYIMYIYAREMNYGFSIQASEEFFKRQSLIFLVIIAFILYFPISKFRKSRNFNSIQLSEVNLENYMKSLSMNKPQEDNLYKEITDTIIKLSEMVDKGILTEEEFNSKKRDLLSRL